MVRTVGAEILDGLPADDERAIHSRRDLQRVNTLMGHPWMLARALRDTVDGSRVVELGAGDGTLLLKVAKRLGRPARPVHAVLVDLRPSLSAETRAGFDAAGWHVDVSASDVFAWLKRPDPGPSDLIIANLFLHHFEEPALSELLDRVSAQTRRFVACEPIRSPAALVGASMLRFVGCNDVTQRDARVSVRAGFRGRELSALWPRRPGWRLLEGRSGPFTHRFMANHAA